jgi:hypothetical protein
LRQQQGGAPAFRKTSLSCGGPSSRLSEIKTPASADRGGRPEHPSQLPAGKGDRRRAYHQHSPRVKPRRENEESAAREVGSKL